MLSLLINYRTLGFFLIYSSLSQLSFFLIFNQLTIKQNTKTSATDHQEFSHNSGIYLLQKSSKLEEMIMQNFRSAALYFFISKLLTRHWLTIWQELLRRVWATELHSQVLLSVMQKFNLLVTLCFVKVTWKVSTLCEWVVFASAMSLG